MFVQGGISASSEPGLLPPPLVGEGWGGGERAHMNLFACGVDFVACPSTLLHAPSLPLPRKRGTERTECAAGKFVKQKRTLARYTAVHIRNAQVCR
jgi:hypothetical protein